ncbi:MAG: LysR family transcriptional regulator [Planctomycetota bacterium]
MQLRTLEIFCAVADQRSFSKAAAAFDLTQSAVSQAIQHLEDELNSKLIDRSKRPLVLTASGAAYHQGLRGILRDYHQLEQNVRRSSQRLEGKVRVGTIYSAGLSYMPDAMAEFSRRHAGVDVRLQFDHSHKVVDMVEAGDVDLGLVSFPRNTKQLSHVVWQNEPMRLVCSDKHALAERNEIAADDLQGQVMIGFDRHLVLRQEIDRRLSKAQISVDFRLEFDNTDSMVRAIEAHRGIGFLPEAVVRRETASGSLRVIRCPSFQMHRPLGFIFRRSAKPSAEVIEFVSLLLGRPLSIDHRGRVQCGTKSSSSLPSGSDDHNDNSNIPSTTSVVA